MGIFNVLFLELILCAVFLEKLKQAILSSHFCLFQNGLIDLLTPQGSYFITKKFIKCYFAKNVEDRVIEL